MLFFFKLRVAYPDRAAFEEILRRTTEPGDVVIQPAFDGTTLAALGDYGKAVPVAPAIRSRAAVLVMATHPETKGAGEHVRDLSATLPARERVRPSCSPQKSVPRIGKGVEKESDTRTDQNGTLLLTHQAAKSGCLKSPKVWDGK